MTGFRPGLACDVLLTSDNRIFINGHEIGGITAVHFNHDPGNLPRLELELIPTSIIQGSPPQEEITRLHEQQNLSDPDARVDITKAINQARARVRRTSVAGQGDEVSEAGGRPADDPDDRSLAAPGP